MVSVETTYSILKSGTKETRAVLNQDVPKNTVFVDTLTQNKIITFVLEGPQKFS